MLTLQTKKVSNMTKKGKHTVLFICLGNICRSPAAEGIMKSLVEKAGLQDEFEIDSAGIGSWHVGQLPDSRMRKCGAEHGYNFNSHARQFQKSDFARFETIVVMDNENYRAITSMASSESDRKKVVRQSRLKNNILCITVLENIHCHSEKKFKKRWMVKAVPYHILGYFLNPFKRILKYAVCNFFSVNYDSLIDSDKMR